MTVIARNEAIQPALLDFFAFGSHGTAPALIPAAARDGARAGVGALRFDALARRLFWLLSLSAFLVMSTVAASIIHLFPMLTDRGLSGEAAARIAAVLAASGLLSSLTTGILLDYVAPWVLGLPFYFDLKLVAQAGMAPPNASRRRFAVIRSTVSNPSVKRS
jgi:hypothetical protein